MTGPQAAVMTGAPAAAVMTEPTNATKKAKVPSKPRAPRAPKALAPAKPKALVQAEGQTRKAMVLALTAIDTTGNETQSSTVGKKERLNLSRP